MEPASLRALFRHRDFRAFLLGRQCGWLASSIEDVAVGWHVYGLRHSALDLGLVGLFLFLPQLLLALPAGVLADHRERRTISIAVGLTNVIGVLLFVALIYGHITSLAVNFAVITFIGVSYTLGVPAQRSILVNIVAGETYVRASALSSTIAQLITILGPAIAGALIIFGTPVAFFAAALFHLVSTFGYVLLRPIGVKSSMNGKSLWQTAVEGLRFIFKRKVILGAISLDLFAVLFGGATALLPIYAQTILHVGATGFGWLRAAPAIGAALVAAVIARRPLRRHAGPWLYACVAGFGVFTIVFGLSHNFALSMIALAIAGGCDMVSMVIRGALTQLQTPSGMLGRVGAVENIFIGASNELGAFESGGVAALIGPQASVVLGGAATIAVIALWTVLFPALRRFDELTGTQESE